MKKLFYIIGAGLVVGTTAAAILYMMELQKVQGANLDYGFKKQDRKNIIKDGEHSTEVSINQNEPIYKDIKNSVIGSLDSRHKNASFIMEDSVKSIHKNIKVSEDTNDKIDKISSELDKMLSED